MNELYAFDPELINVDRLKKLIQFFSLEEGRFVAGYPLNWKADVREKCLSRGTSLNQIETHRLFEKIVEWSGYMEVPAPFERGRGISWLHNALRVNQRKKLFDRIFVGDECKNEEERVAKASHFFDGEILISSGRQGWISPNAGDYAKVCHPLFSVSTEVVLYDYKFATRYVDKGGNARRDGYRLGVLESLVRSMVDMGRTKRFLLVMNEKHVGHLDRYLEEDLSQVKKVADPECQVQLNYYLDDGAFKGGSSHPRCIFSVKGGLHFDQGFQTNIKNEANLVSYLTSEALRPLQEKLLSIFHNFEDLKN